MLRLLSLSRAFCSASNQVSKFRYKFDYASSLIPHPQKAYKGGEDALFASENVLFVADGVGGWAESGIDPGLYSKKLASLVQQLVSKDKQNYINNPKQLIKQAVSLNKQTGSTTVCLLTLNPSSGLLRAYYLGDSIYAIINPTNESYRVAPQQQYQFNFPYQVGTNGANPLHGIYHQYKAEEIAPEEFIVVGSDGIWDNLRDYMIYQIVGAKVSSLQTKADTLTKGASHYGRSGNYESPFHLKAKQQGIDFPKQGKLDDNAAIVAKIVKEQL